MNKIDKKKFIQKYQGKILAESNCGLSHKYKINDFLDENDLISFLYDYFDHEVDFTKDGYSFLKGYYGIYEVAKLIYDENKTGAICNYGLSVLDLVEYIKDRGYIGMD